MAVVLEHVRSLFFVDPSGLKLNLFEKVFYLLTGLGHQAVILFFVLSGAVITLVVGRDFSKGRFTVKRYVVHRMVRLWVVLVPALIACAILDVFAAQQGWTTHTVANQVVPSPVLEKITIGSFVGNIFFLQTIAVNVFGSNQPLWSLAYEFWFYILFPLGVLAAFSLSILTRIIAGLFLCLLVTWLPSRIVIYFVIWLMGSVAALAPAPKMNRLFAIGGTAILAAVSFAWILAGKMMPDLARSIFWMDFVFAILVTGLLWFVRSDHLESALPKIRLLRFGEWQGGMSYSTYLFHLPLLLFVAGMGGAYRSWTLSLTTAIMAVALVLLAIGYSWGAHFMFERNTNYIRTLVESRMNGRSAH